MFANIVEEKNIFSKKLHIDLSRKEFCKKLLKHLDHVKKINYFLNNYSLTNVPNS